MYKRLKDNKFTCTLFFLNNINKNLEIKIEKKNFYKIKCNQSLSKIHNLRGENPLKKNETGKRKSLTKYENIT